MSCRLWVMTRTFSTWGRVVAFSRRVHPVSQDGDVTRRQSCTSLVHEFVQCWPDLGDLPHPLDVAARPPVHSRELGLKIGRSHVNDLCAPTRLTLALDDVVPDGPVKAHDLSVGRSGSAELGRSDSGLGVSNPLGIADGRDVEIADHVSVWQGHEASISFQRLLTHEPLTKT